MQLPSEVRSSLYGLLGNLQWPAYVGMLVFATVKYKLPAKHKIALWAAFVIARFWSSSLLPVLSRLTNRTIPGNNLGVAFGLFVIGVAAITYFSQTSVAFSLDAAVPAFILGRGLAISGCIFLGCCHGFPVLWGIYSGVTKTFTFPTVCLDSITSCCIVIYLVFLARKQNYVGNGTVAANGIILFGFLRIIVDILRDNRKLVFLFTAEGFCGIAYVVVGYLILRAICKRGEKNVI